MSSPDQTTSVVEHLKRENSELTAQIREYEKLFELMPVAIATAAGDDTIKVNKVFAEMLGTRERDHIALRSGADHQLPYRFTQNGRDVAEGDFPHQKALLHGREIEAELEIERTDGQRFHLLGFARPLLADNGEAKRSICVFVDVTERKRAEHDAEVVLNAVKQANEELQQFAYAASHDLQEPLRSISSYAQLLQRRVPDDGDLKDYTDFIVDGVERMNALIRDLLTYSRAGISPRHVNVNLELALQWVQMNLQTAIADAGAQITSRNLPEVFADETQMSQLLQNLLSNALKYRGGNAAKIEVFANESEDQYKISVKDHGVGVDPRFHQQIFGVFKRLHGRDIPGTGIGLALCRKIVEAHRGKIWVESDGHHGSTFTFTLPK